MAKIDQQKTTMLIKEVYTVENGDNAGDLVINIVARRGSETYALPYHVSAAKIKEFDIDSLMAKVRQDVTEREAEANQSSAVIDKIRGMMTAPIALD